jgi:ElaA protein
MVRHASAPHEAQEGSAQREPGAAGTRTRVDVRWQWRAFDALSVAELYAALALRSAVFVVEQACVFLDLDGHDADARHLLGFADTADPNAQLIAYLRLLAPGHKYAEPSIGRVIAAPAYRGMGLGRAAMHEALLHARALYPGQPIRIGAQEYLRAFYESFGFRVASPSYDEDGIPHIEMLLAPDIVPSMSAI